MTDPDLPNFSASQAPAVKPNTRTVVFATVRMVVVAAVSGVAAVVMATGLAGCADMSGIQSTAHRRDTASLGFKFGGPGTPTIQAEWWREFGDASLNQLIAQALQDSPNLKLAQARLARVQAVTEVAGAATRPQINGQLDITRQQYTANGAVPPPLAGTVRNSGVAQLSGSWELDFFGKNRAALDAALGTANAAEADVQAARVMLASNVARTYFQILRLNEQSLLARRTLAQRTEILMLVQARVQAGLDTKLELNQSEGSLPDARLQLEALQEQLALTQNALAVLVGQPNRTLVVYIPALTAIKNVANTASAGAVIPADLLGRRADIEAARWRVEAAGKDVVNAKTQFYPNINLVAFAGFSSIGLGRLLDAGSQQAGIGPALRLPIFDAGRLRANLRGKSADLDAAVETYNAAVIDAVRDVADQITLIQAIARQQTEQRAAQASSKAAYDIAVQRYRAGLSNFVNVLTAESQVLIQQRSMVDLVARALDTQVALIRALGGGYQPEGNAARLSSISTQLNK